MKACIIAYTFYEVDFRVRRYADALVSAGYNVDVFALRRKGQSRRENLNGVNIYRLQERDYNEKGLKSFLVRMIFFFARVFFLVLAMQFRYRYRIVHIHNPPDFLVFSALVQKILGAKIIFDMHENLPEFYCAKFNKNPGTYLVKVLLVFEKMATNFADFTIVAHDLLRERVIKRDGITEKNCVALLNYPPKTFFKPLIQKRDEEEFRIIYPGTISYQHGVDIAIKAMAIVKEECKLVKLDIYGGSRDQMYYQELTRLTDDLTLNGIVSFHGIVPFEEIRNILAEGSIGVVPKRGGIFGSEAFSTKILEFMAVGIPVIVSKTKIDEYYFDSSMVMFFEPENHIDLAKCILELYRNAEKRQRLTNKGREFIEKNNWEIKSQMYLDIIGKLVGAVN
jgi:glycosyltransferase involved in cell wall biosynthesis